MKNRNNLITFSCPRHLFHPLILFHLDEKFNTEPDNPFNDQLIDCKNKSRWNEWKKKTSFSSDSVSRLNCVCECRSYSVRLRSQWKLIVHLVFGGIQTFCGESITLHFTGKLRILIIISYISDSNWINRSAFEWMADFLNCLIKSCCWLNAKSK